MANWKLCRRQESSSSSEFESLSQCTDDTACEEYHDQSWTDVGEKCGEDKIPMLCGFPIYSHEVVDFANEYAKKHGKEVRDSWCVGPVLLAVSKFVLFQSLGALMVAALSFFFSECIDHTPQYPGWLWAPYGVFMVSQLELEFKVFKFRCIPFLQRGGEWTAFTINAFTWWFFVSASLSTAHLVSLGSANLFLGKILRMHWEGWCGADDISLIWETTLGQSYTLHAVPVPFTAVLISVFVFQFFSTARVFGVLPEYGQFTTNGRNYDFHAGHEYDYYTNDLELEVVEWIEPREGGISVEKKPRPNGTRYVYFNIWKKKTLTGAAVEVFCDALGMASVQLMRDAVFNKVEYAEKEIRKLCSKGSKDRDGEDFMEIFATTRSCLQDANVVFQTLTWHTFLFGFRFQGSSLHLQVTYFNAWCLVDESVHQHESARKLQLASLWLGVGSSILSTMGLLMRCKGCMKYLIKVVFLYACCETIVIPEVNRSEATDKLTKMIEDVESEGSMLPRRLCFSVMSLMCLILNLAWVVTKLTMSHVCRYRIWNASIDLMYGCVDLSDVLNASSMVSS